MVADNRAPCQESYLLQTRLQKMPYKHIAAHLNKTELACRLHYHQLSHGSTRRKRTTSCSSGSSDPASGLAGLAPSPIPKSKSRSISPAHGLGSYMTTPSMSDVQLPSIMTTDRSPRLPAILPKPEPVAFSHPSESPRRYPILMAEQAHEHLPSVSFQHGSHSYHSAAPPLRLDCRGLSPPSASVHGPAHVDLSRLHAIYEAHREGLLVGHCRRLRPKHVARGAGAGVEVGRMLSSARQQPHHAHRQPGQGPEAAVPDLGTRQDTNFLDSRRRHGAQAPVRMEGMALFGVIIGT